MKYGVPADSLSFVFIEEGKKTQKVFEEEDMAKLNTITQVRRWKDFAISGNTRKWSFRQMSAFDISSKFMIAMLPTKLAWEAEERHFEKKKKHSMQF